MLRRILAPSIVLACALGSATVLATTEPAMADSLRVIPVPTANAGLGRVTSISDGTVFFVEGDAGKFGYVGPSGTVAETALFGGAGSDQVTAFDVAPEGRVWTSVRRPQTIVTSQTRTGTDLGSLGVQGPVIWRNIRTTADGHAWLARDGGGSVLIAEITVSGGGGGSSGVVGAPGSDSCGSVIGLGGDGHVWCAATAGLMSLTPSAAGPARAVPGGTGFVRAIAPGPAGSTWFTRYEGGALVTGVNGGIGYVDSAGAVHYFNLGARTAPTDLAMAPDGTMWFTSAGDAAGIGHISPDGTGALTALPGYSPRHLTVTADGTVVATDPVHNVVLAVSPTLLQSTSVDPGAGSVLRPSAAVPAKGKKGLRLKHGAGRIHLSCPTPAPNGCAGSVGFVSGKGKPLSTTPTFALAAGETRAVKVKLTKRGLRQLPRHGAVKLRLAVTVAVSGEVVTSKVKVRR